MAVAVLRWHLEGEDARFCSGSRYRIFLRVMCPYHVARAGHKHFPASSISSLQPKTGRDPSGRMLRRTTQHCLQFPFLSDLCYRLIRPSSCTKLIDACFYRAECLDRTGVAGSGCQVNKSRRILGQARSCLAQLHGCPVCAACDNALAACKSCGSLCMSGLP